MTEDASAPAADAPLVREVLPRLADVLRQELLRRGEDELAEQVNSLCVSRPCACNDYFCQSFSTEDHEPGTTYGSARRTLPLLQDSAMVNVDVVQGRIVYVEIIV